jgi:hypothetical protein
VFEAKQRSDENGRHKGSTTMKSVKGLVAALVFGGTVLGGTQLTARTVEPVNAPAFESASVTVPERPVPERAVFTFRWSDAPRPLPPLFMGRRSDERPDPVWRGYGDRPVVARRFRHPRWTPPGANVAETLVPTDQLPE